VADKGTGMNPAAKALWFIETHFTGEITLEDIADVAGVSRYHLTRAFGEATGYSIMRYVRGRRLTEAARLLANGAPDILAVALDAGYNSHEAFTRAFRDQFGLTPEAVRAQGHLDNIQLLEPIIMQKTMQKTMQQTLTTLEPPRVETGRVLLIAGLSERYTRETSAAIPALWQRFVPHLGHIPGQLNHVAYGVMYNGDEEGNFDYLCGVEVEDFSRVPADWSLIRITPQRYAVFVHREHISSIRGTMNAIWNKWLPESELKPADAPAFERYDENFDGRTGLGGLEIWIPIKEDR
jgi:AraC family transcriptional regulator